MPIAEAELAYGEAFDAAMSGPGLDWDEDLPEFPELDGPVFLLGTCALEDAIPGLDGQVAADAHHVARRQRAGESRRRRGRAARRRPPGRTGRAVRARWALPQRLGQRALTLTSRQPWTMGL
jgi:hypothetical protein